MIPLQAVSSPRLYRIIAGQIAGRIREGEFAPGDRLPSERDLAEHLQVSRASVREALIALELEGYVDVRVGTGVFVTNTQAGERREIKGVPSIHDAGGNDMGPFDLLETRLLLEPESASLAAQVALPAQIVAIEAAHRAMNTADAPGRHDRAFHLAISASCGNAALASAITHLWSLSQSSPVYSRMETHFVTRHVWEQAKLEHEQILNAIAQRDPGRARHAMHDHLVGILARLRADFGRTSL
ncbi:FadR/GntR family transcriptional regulator [Bordetella tumulicola]|uniref:FadR/GntR family transcriptional regulator n=1 Tax=Bordetella tumulicola TaxID=1649133 RepID=UPI0039EFAA46